MRDREFPEALRRARRRKELTQEELATAVGCSVEAIRSWETARRAPSEEYLARLTELLPDLKDEPSPPEDSGQSLVLRPAAGLVEAEGEAPPDGEEFGVGELRQRLAELEAENERLSELARVAPGTEVANKRAVDEALVKTLRAAHRRGESVALLFLDLDHFKALNTRHGHPACNEFLKQFAASMSGLVRDGDLFGRWGGEEFCAVLENATLAQARKTAERMRARTAELIVDGIGTTVSIGVAAYQAPKRTPDEGEVAALAQKLLAEANQAQGWAKADGRNRVDAFSAERVAARSARSALVHAAGAGSAASSKAGAAGPSSRLWVGTRIAALAASMAFFAGPSCCAETGCPQGSIRINGRCLPGGSECPDSSCIDR